MSGSASSAGAVHIPRRGIFGWMMFDWAAQPFFTVIITFIFGPYFVAQLASDPDVGQAWWGYTIAASGFVIAILSPVLGATADATGSRKRWIAAFAIVKIVCLALLWFAEPGSPLIYPFLLIVVASIAAEVSIVFNDSMMPTLMTKDEIGKYSNIAWGLGYLGGMVVLILVVALMAGSPETGKTLLGLDPIFGLDPVAGEGARATGPLSAIWYAVFLLPLFLLTPDVGTRRPLRAAVRQGLSEVKATWWEIRERTGILKFLIARMIYQDGVNGLIALGGTFAAGMFAWSTTEVGVFGIILTVVAIFGCIVASRLDLRLGAKTMVMASLVCLLVATVGIISTGPGFTLFGIVQLGNDDSGGLFGTPAEKAYILFGLLIGLAFGPVQASSRSYLARSVEPEEAGRYFGFYALSGRATSFLAPFLVATVTAVSGSARLGMAVLIIFLLVGMVVLAITPYPASTTKAARINAGSGERP
jgi:MFS transporter, UMF1 family